jgi:hypothetical protein
MATATKATKVFEGLRCPHCGEIDSLSVKLETLAVECNECSETVTKAEVEAILATWRRLFNWIDSAATLADPK